MSSDAISHEEVTKLEPMSEAYCALNRITIGKKKITYMTGTWQDVKISFERGVAHTGKPDFCIEIQEERPTTTKCSLGHEHTTGKRGYYHAKIQMSWEQAEALMEWFSAGDFRKVREATKREKAAFEEFKRAKV